MPPSLAGAHLVGTTVGRFEILRELGRGGFGVVYEARDQQLGRRVAFKALHAGLTSLDEVGGARLLAEAEAGARLSHPNIVTVYDVSLSSSPPYLVLEWLHGETLGERIHRGVQPLDEALRIAIEVGRALEHAHKAGVIHRDLKPSNVFLTTDGHVKVLDFGLARFQGQAEAPEGGTPGYMAPEQWREEPQDARTDVFAAAAMLFESLTGRLPYRMVAGRCEVLEPGPEAPVLPGVPRPLDRLVRRALARRPADRPASGRAWLEGLLAVQRQVSPKAREAGRRRWLVIGLGLGLVAAGTGVWTVRREWREELRREARLSYERARASFLDESAAPLRQDAVTLAQEHAPDLGPRERGHLLAWADQLRGDDAAALRRYEGLRRADPADAETAYLAGDLLFHEHRLQAALPWLEAATAGDHPDDWALDHLVVTLHELGRRDELAKLGRQLATRPPTAGNLHALSIAWGSIGERGASLAAARRELQAGGGVTALDDLVASLFQAGELAQAEALLRERLNFEGSGQVDARHALAVVLGAQGRRREGLALWDATATGWNVDPAVHHVLRAAYQSGGGSAALVWRDVADVRWPPWSTFDVALVLAYLGDSAHAAAVARALGHEEQEACQAVLRWRRGQPAGAGEALGAIVGSPGWSHGDLAFMRAEIALGSGRPRLTVELLEGDRARYRRVPLGMFQSWMLPRGFYLEALAHARLGQRREGLAIVRRLLALWRDADADQELLGEARALQASLEHGS